MSTKEGEAVVKDSQPWWQWWLPYLGGIAGFLALLGSLIVFTVSKSIEIYKQTTYKDELVLISYESRINGLFLNSGDGEVFLSHMMIRCPELDIEFVDFINNVVKPKEFLHNSPQKEPPSYSVLTDVSDDEWKEILNILKSGSNQYKKDGKEVTLRLTFLYSNDVALQLYKSNLGQGLRTLGANGELVYFSANSGKRLVQTVPLEAIIYEEPSKPDNTSSPTPHNR